MKRFLWLLVAVMVFTISCSSALEKGQIIIPSAFPLPTPVPIISEPGSVANVKYDSVSEDGIIDMLGKFVFKKGDNLKAGIGTLEELKNLTPKNMWGKQQTLVLLDDNPVAIIPVTSKYNGVRIHKECTRWSYGTNRWYSCEVMYATL